MPPKYNVGDVVQLLELDDTPRYITITAVHTIRNSSYAYDGEYTEGYNPNRIEHIFVPESTILGRVMTADGNFVGNGRNSDRVAFHLSMLNNARNPLAAGGPSRTLAEVLGLGSGGGAAAAGGGGGGGGGASNSGFNPFTSILPRGIVQQIMQHRSGVPAGGRAAAAGGAAAAAFEESLAQASLAPPTHRAASGNPDAPKNAINNNEDPKPHSRGGRRRSRISTKRKRRVRRNKSRKH